MLVETYGVLGPLVGVSGICGPGSTHGLGTERMAEEGLWGALAGWDPAVSQVAGGGGVGGETVFWVVVVSGDVDCCGPVAGESCALVEGMVAVCSVDEGQAAMCPPA